MGVASPEEQGQPIERLSKLMRTIILVLRDRSPQWVASNEIIDARGIGAASFYPTARKLRRSPWVEWQWEQPGDDTQAKPFMVYRLTPLGAELGRELELGQIKGRAWREFVPEAWAWM